MSIELHVWKLVGITPLLQNNPCLIGLSDDGGLTVGKKKYDDDEEAAIRTYKDDDGTYYHPSTAIRVALLTACTNRKLGKKAAKGVVAGSVFPAEDKITICNGNGKPMKKYAVDKRPAKVGTARILRCRPMWKNWSMQVPLEVDTDFVQPKDVTELLNIAGRIIGIGDMRPDTSKGKNGVGSFGRFEAEMVK